MVAPRNFNSVSYSPGQVPTDQKEFPRYMREEYDKLAAAISRLAAGHLDPVFVEPAKRQDGDLCYAAGAPDWNPGSGRGVYIYKINTWTFLG